MADEPEIVKIRGYYVVDGKKFISVTNVLNVIPKPGVTFWYGKHGTEECKRLTEKSQEFGELLHKLFEFNVLGKDVNLKKYNSAVQKTYKSFMSWKKKHKITGPQPEKKLFSKKLKYAGTCDLIADIDKTLRIVDYKTLLDKEDVVFYNEMYFQLSAYIHALFEMTGKKASGGILLVSNNHDHQYTEFDFEKSEEIFPKFRKSLELKRELLDNVWKKTGIFYDEQGNKNL